MDTRIIFHVDMDAFFASVEILRNPRLKGKPVIVGGDPSKRGVVSTCSYEARKFGVRSAMSLAEAKRRCPHGVFLDVDFSLYRAYSDQVMQILKRYTPHVEIVSIDEAYLDVTQIASCCGGAFKLGQIMRKNILEKTKLTCSLGIGSNKLIAKIASSLAKPNGLYEVPVGSEIVFLSPLPIEAIPGIGVKTQSELNRDGLFIVKDLQQLGQDELIRRYGAYGYHFWLSAFGKDNRPVVSDYGPPKSIGAETTFDIDQVDQETLLQTMDELADKALGRLERYKMRARGVSVKLRFSDFRTITRATTFESHLNDPHRIKDTLHQLFNRSWDKESALRLVGVTLEKLTNSYWQPTFWDKFREKNRGKPIEI